VTGDLVEWIRAQLEDDQRFAQRLQDHRPGPWTIDADYGGEPAGGTAVMDSAGELVAVARGGYVGDYIADHDPARVLRDVAAHRKIIDVHDPARHEYPELRQCPVCISDQTGYPELWNPDQAPCSTLRLLAAIFDDRPGYQEEWRP
jgi:Family of unknown function (DUF6221)